MRASIPRYTNNPLVQKIGQAKGRRFTRRRTFTAMRPMAKHKSPLSYSERSCTLLFMPEEVLRQFSVFERLLIEDSKSPLRATYAFFPSLIHESDDAKACTASSGTTTLTFTGISLRGPMPLPFHKPMPAEQAWRPAHPAIPQSPSNPPNLAV